LEPHGISSAPSPTWSRIQQGTQDNLPHLFCFSHSSSSPSLVSTADTARITGLNITWERDSVQETLHLLLTRLIEAFWAKNCEPEQNSGLAENKQHHLPSIVKETDCHLRHGVRAENCRNKGREEERLGQEKDLLNQ
jgi:hypothetical protein